MKKIVLILIFILILSCFILPYSWAYVLGDVSGEGEVRAYDAALIAQKAVGLL